MSHEGGAHQCPSYRRRRHIVVGGGVAGVCCALELRRLAANDDEICLISGSPAVKGVTNVERLAPHVEAFGVADRDAASLAGGNLRVLMGWVTAIDLRRREVTVELAQDGAPAAAAAAAGAAAAAATVANGDASPTTTTTTRTTTLTGPPPQQTAVLRYDALCLAVGARPKRLAEAAHSNPRVLTLRDAASLAALASKLRGARRVAVVGNGGIALELAGELRGRHGAELLWVARHGAIGDAFFDVDAAAFLLADLEARQAAAGGGGDVRGCEPQTREQQTQQQQTGQPQQQQQQQTEQQQQQMEQQQQVEQQQPSRLGAAMGPAWVRALPGGAPARVTVARGAAVVGVFDSRAEALAALAGAGGTDNSGGGQADADCSGNGWPVWLALAGAGTSGGDGNNSSSSTSGGDDNTNSSTSGGPAPRLPAAIGADVVVAAVGVVPATEWLPAGLERAPDGGLAVGAGLRTSDPHVWAAGDCCTLRPEALAPHFFQMRLWTQARAMGAWAAAGMAGRAADTGAGFAFELFAHATRFLGRKVVLLGLYNGQKLERAPPGDVVTYARALGAPGAPDATFARALLLRGRVAGAVLIGDTGLEETFENLILDGLDVGAYGPALLDPSFELDHVFD